MKPFNLKKALAGEPVVTRDGRPVTQLTHFSGLTYTLKALRGVVETSIDAWDIEGRWETGGGGYAKDLFMAPNKHAVQVAIWKSRVGEAVRYLACNNCDYKIGDSRDDQTLVAIQTIEWEE